LLKPSISVESEPLGTAVWLLARNTVELMGLEKVAVEYEEILTNARTVLLFKEPVVDGSVCGLAVLLSGLDAGELVMGKRLLL